jgi:hypothetical protein
VLGLDERIEALAEDLPRLRRRRDDAQVRAGLRRALPRPAARSPRASCGSPRLVVPDDEAPRVLLQRRTSRGAASQLRRKQRR